MNEENRAQGQGQPEANLALSLLPPSGPNDSARGSALPGELPGMPAPTEGRPEPDGDYTLERTKQFRQDAYKIARRLLENGVTVNGVCEICSMGKHTVLAIADEMGNERGMTLDETGRRVLLREARRGAVLGALRATKMLEDEGENAPPLRDVAMTVKVLNEAAQLISGEPTGRVEVTGPKVEDVLGELERLQGKG